LILSPPLGPTEHAAQNNKRSERADQACG
jgi:hypothetical protein